MARVVLKLRSGPSNKACYLRFINRTARKVNVVWIDYLGYTRNYGTLDPNRQFDVFSYEGHPWICEDSVTKSRMLLNKSDIFFPASRSEPRDEDGSYPTHLSKKDAFERMSCAWEFVFITVPVFPLKELCAEAVVKSIHSEDAISSLDIPAELKNTLQSYYLHPSN